MDITGYDNVIFTCGDPRPPVMAALNALAARWGGSKVQAESPEGVPAIANPTIEKLNIENGYILVLRDDQMEMFMDAHGFAAMEDGEGPVAFWYRKRGPVGFELQDLIEVVNERVYNIDPYQACFYSDVVYEITAVTPQHPDSHAFSGWVVDQVKQACLKPRGC